MTIAAPNPEAGTTSIVIGVPSYGRMASEPVGSLLRLQRWLLDQGYRVSVIQHAMAEIARSRNIISTLFYERPENTHLLFVDSDMVFEPEIVGRLIAADKPLVGAAYPKRSINLDALISAARTHSDRSQILASAMEFVFHPLGDRIDVENGFCEVEGLGMGLCLIRRDVLETLAPYVSRDVEGGRGRTSGPILGFFDQTIASQGLLSEDLAFCRRWRDRGGQVWALIDEPIGHLGDMIYSARLLDAFKARGE